jgi:tripartite-type tricarboxylate transporter receptor subunit TctC
MSGTVHMMFADPVTGTQLAKAGKVRALAVSSKTRLSVYPELLPIAEAGVPGYEATNWHMLLAPANTPKEVVERLSSEVRAILATPEVRDQIIKIGLEPQISPPPAALPQVIEADVARWGPIVQQTGLAGSM